MALVAGSGGVLKVHTAGPLQQVPSGRGDVAQLAGGPGQQRLAQDGVALPDGPISRHVAVGHGGTDAQTPVGQLFDPIRGDPPDVDEQVGCRDPEPHVVDEVRTAGQVHRVRRRDEHRDGAGYVRGPFVAERLHREHSWIGSPRGDATLTKTLLGSGHRLGLVSIHIGPSSEPMSQGADLAGLGETTSADPASRALTMRRPMG